jgi:hypothetical protein
LDEEEAGFLNLNKLQVGRRAPPTLLFIYKLFFCVFREEEEENMGAKPAV